MSLPIPIMLQALCSGEKGLLEDIEPPDPLAGKQEAKDLSWIADAMPLILIPRIEGSLEDAFDAFEQQANAINLVEGTTRTLGTVTFTEYSFTHTDTSLTSVYALTSGHLYYLPAGKSDSGLLSGAIPDEDVFILKPLKSILDVYWKDSHPGRKPLLEECAYLNVSLVSDENLKLLIQRSSTEEYFKKIYKLKRGSEFQGDNWDAEYLKLFKEFPDVPVLVRGGAQIGSIKNNSQTDPTQRITLFFKFTLEGQQELWTGMGHDEAVKTFFKYYRRRGSGLVGHPLIAKLIGESVRSGTVDVIPPEPINFLSFKLSDPLRRTKSSFISDFKLGTISTGSSYHPLALDPDEHPHRLIIPKSPSTAIPPTEVPPYLVPLLGPEHWVTKLKIHNPLGLTVTIEGFNAAEVSINPFENIVATQQIVEVRASETLFPGNTERKIQVKADGALVHEIVLTFLDFHAVPVKFYKLSDTDPNNQTVIHQANIDEQKLREVIAYANEILGRQTNVYVYPVEQNFDGSIIILHEIVFFGDLGDPISKADVRRVADDFFFMNQPYNIHAIFAWNQEATENNSGVTTYSDDANLAIILVDTEGPQQSSTYLGWGTTLVHELGHWFSNIFSRVPNLENGLPECTGSFIYFDHPGDLYEGCPGGDWSFNNNLMASAGGLLITFEQAKVFNENAHQVLP
ncbi:MAG: hypothetical protein E3K36_04475 [Candidatus Brocadia sp.]|nr:hypothetical protein [Candidatus Brocadia sp.]